ncbi:HNH endonuclease signature motif containing protein [Cryobacterium tepidiphilum]|uniref:HNH endonuclease n=1 Tax=Cryobacterium tepidiphilum TaxID=2486026 RepID=A0A3M8LEX2_9MICO|nr:HNH endonuclease signature motif containing protein [Cryobacterium tepidiphilum]RNE64103.1 HNH endonuclease [Cryobacterium tepidiphilum]
MTLLASNPDVDQPDEVDPIRVLEATTATLLETVPVGTPGKLDDERALRWAAAAETLGRYADALRVAAASDISHRSRPELLEKKLSTRKGCRNEVELLERVTLVSGATVRRRLRLGKNFRRGMTLTGEPIPAAFPVIAAAVAAGALGLDGADAIITVLTPALPRVHPDQLGLAEAALVAAATGTSGEDSGVPVSADLSRVQAGLWLAHLNPDGAEPREVQAMQNRGLRFGREQGGLIPVTGMLMPETAAAAKRVIDAYMSPRTAPVAFIDEELAARGETHDPSDTRTPDQKRHDIFAVIVATAAKAADTPTIAGDAPTVLVSVRQEDLEQGTGVGHIDGVETPISMDAVRQMICAGGLQKVVLKKNGKIVELGTKERTFNRAQRRAIMLRDGGCIIPGCDIPAAWTEIHHVWPDRDGGPTHTSKGVCLCWFHHRTIETSGWEIRMIDGSPQIKAPPWIDRTGRWRPATKSPTRLTDQLEQTHGK